MAGSLASVGASPGRIEVLVDPAAPSGPTSLVFASDGNFYGTTAEGGAHGQGTFFRATAQGALEHLSSFGGDNGPRPASLAQGPDGYFYGFADVGGRSPDDVIVRVSPGGVSTIIFDFFDGAGWDPRGLAVANDGNLYGTTHDGGAYGGGTAFKVGPGGVLTFIADFEWSDAGPRELVQASDGNFYGILSARQNPAPNRIFRMTPAGVVSIVYTFNESTDGAAPDRLAVGRDGNLYGTTAANTETGARTIYRITLSGEFTLLNTSAELFWANVRLVRAPDGHFYVAKHSHYDGNGGFLPGTVYRVSLTGAVTTIYEFAAGSPGKYPANLSVGHDGALYGTSYSGGTKSGGTIFRLSTDGHATQLHAFAATNPPASSLVEAPDGSFYGTTETGGAHTIGTAFRMTADGTITRLVDLKGANGDRARGALTLAADGNFYGTTLFGGAFGRGTIFRLTPQGTLTTLFSFDGLQGANPVGPLIERDDGLLYGLALEGGSGSAGTAFRISPNSGVFATIANFTGATGLPAPNGYTPSALALTSNGEFFGFRQGGNQQPSTLFRLTPEGQITTMHEFSPSEGVPFDLTSGADGDVYGVTTFPGGGGTIFMIDAAGVVSTLWRMQETRSTFPEGGITVGSDGEIYLPVSSDDRISIVRISRDGVATTLAGMATKHRVSVRELVEARDGWFYGTADTAFNAGQVFRVRLLKPRISSVTPGGSKSEIIIRGSSLGDTSRVAFGSAAAANFRVDSDQQITAFLPGGSDATSVAVVTPTGIATYPEASMTAGLPLNISTRGNVGLHEHAMIGGFIVAGDSSKRVVIRAIGPSLAAADVSGALANPTLTLHSANGDVIAENDDWPASADKQVIADTTIAPTDALESAIITNLQAGNYTAVVTGAGETTGVALVEIYDLTPSAGTLANIATRGQVETAQSVLIGGFIIGGDAPARVLVRAVGPSIENGLSPTTGPLNNPSLELYDQAGNLMAKNDDWESGVQRQLIEATGIAPSHPDEAAIIATLEPGNYTGVVRGSDESVGVAVVEVYKLD